MGSFIYSQREKNVLKQFIFVIFVTIKTHIVIGDLLTDPQVMSLNVIGSSCCLFFQLPLHLWVACGQILGHEMEMEVCWRWWGEMGSFVKLLAFLIQKKAGVSFSLPHTFELPA